MSISVQPIQLWRYISYKRIRIPSAMKRLFYLSWEDALWDILQNKKINKGSYILVPEFFCGDVEKNMKSHGYRVAYYSVNETLVSDVRDLKSKIKIFKPSTIVIFHPVGITSNLIKDTSWIKTLPDEVVLIEDCVHRVVDPHHITFFKVNHFVLDSLRKVTPLQGSCLYGQQKDINWQEPSMSQSIIYSTHVFIYFICMNIFLNASQLLRSSFMGKLAETFMIKGYNVIGTSPKSAGGLGIMNFLQQYLDLHTIQRTKELQVICYEQSLQRHLPVNVVYAKDDRKQLRGWPVILSISQGLNVITQLRSVGLLVRFELNDSVWSHKHKIIYLPLGLHISSKQQEWVCKQVLIALGYRDSPILYN